MPDARTQSGARSAVDLLNALTRNDVAVAQAVLDNCDAGSTIFALASAWIALVEMQGLNTTALLDQMRAAIDGGPR